MQKKKPKTEREEAVLLGLVDLYLKTGKPVGSNTLRESGFQELSSATIRNYCANLEKNGYLLQQHSSGGRIPTSAAYKVYAKGVLDNDLVGDEDKKLLIDGLQKETRVIAKYLQQATDLISERTGCAALLTFPRFDHDLIIDIKLVSIDTKRFLCIIITDFGVIHTETLYSEKKLSSFSLKRIEAYFHFRMTGHDMPKLSKEEEKLATQFYKEMVLRHIVSTSNFSSEDLYKTGFAHLLNYPEFQDAGSLALGLSLFENTAYMKELLRNCQELKVWIGDDLSNESMHCSLIAIPYYVNKVPVGTIALLGPTRIPYQKIFSLLRLFSALLSEALTKSLYKYKITYREPTVSAIGMQTKAPSHRGKAECLLLEDKGE
ncbi:MAG: heat-inducible transcriptional repressor HrcA [Simkaniaceae bacterium]|nr:heat-inducible transcriptional repressor HrcA [Simkaniaceae bacterium]